MGAPPRALLAPRHWPTWIGVGLLSLLQLLPAAVRDGLGASVGELQYRLGGRRRQTVELNLGYCFPELSETERAARARAYFHAWARAMADHAVLWWDFRCRVPARRCRVHGLEHVHAQRAAGRPVILLCAHSSAIDFGGVAVASAVPQAAMVNRLGNPVADWLVRGARDRYEGVLLEREQGLRPALRAAREEGVLFYSPDEDLGARDSVFVPFFGRAKATLSTLGRLARALDAAVVPMYAWYDAGERRYQVHLDAPLADFPTGDAEGDARAMNAALEQLIALCPEQYLWSYRLFRTQPDGTRLHYPKRSPWRRYLRRRKRL
ncbi:MAG: lipid A biosynthesis acyltransferase [Halofilum sp. (in: g-proteobacteria)]